MYLAVHVILCLLNGTGVIIIIVIITITGDHQHLFLLQFYSLFACVLA